MSNEFMTLDEYLRHPKIRETLDAFRQQRLRYVNFSLHTAQTRQIVMANRNAYPDNADHLIPLLDERLKILDEILNCIDHLSEIVSGAMGTISSDPVRQMRDVMDKIVTHQKHLKLIFAATTKMMPDQNPEWLN